MKSLSPVSSRACIRPNMDYGDGCEAREQRDKERKRGGQIRKD